MSATARPRLVLASASPARLRLLRDARFDPEVAVSGVDEEAVTAPTPEQLVERLARAKAEVVAARCGDRGGTAPWLVIGCDSVFELDGHAESKPATLDEARARLQAARGRSGRLLTGHCLLAHDGRRAEAVAATTVHFGDYTDAELDAYLATGEALEVAGGFTLDGRSAPFVDGVTGDPSNVIGLSLPTLRRLLGRLGVSVVDLWA